MSAWYVYIVECATDKSLYTGITKNVERRLRQHNGELAGGAKYTRSRRPVRLVYKTELHTQSEALRFEAGVRLLTHEQKRRLAAGGG